MKICDEKPKIKKISIAIPLDAHDALCLDPRVYTLVRKCYNMRVKLYHILNTIHKVVISRVSNGYDQIPQFKRNSLSKCHYLLLMNEYESVTRYTSGCNNFHTCSYHVLRIRLLIYVPREPGALPFNKKKIIICHYINRLFEFT